MTVRGATIRERLWDVVVDQYGYVTTEDANALGIPVVELGKLHHRGRLARVAHGIYRFDEFPTSARDPYMLAVLWAGRRGVLSHDTALEVYELCDVNPARIHLTVPPGYRPRRQGGDGYVVHHEALTDAERGWWKRSRRSRRRRRSARPWTARWQAISPAKRWRPVPNVGCSTRRRRRL